MQKRLSWRWGLLLIILLAGLACAQFARLDHSARQNEARQKFGAVYMTTNNPFYEIIDEEIRTVVENHGDVLISRNPALGADRQIEEIRGLIADGVRVLFINPVDGTQMAEVLQEARAARVIVIAVDTNIDEEGYVAATVVSDNYRAGAQCAEHLIAHAESGRVAVLKHAQARSSQLRIEGFRTVLADHPAFQIVAEEECSGQLEIAMPVMAEMLAAHPEIDVVMALNDPAALGAIAGGYTGLRRGRRTREQGAHPYGLDDGDRRAVTTPHRTYGRRGGVPHPRGGGGGERRAADPTPDA